MLAGSNNKTDMFPPMPWTPDMRERYCKEKWGVAQRPGWSVTQLWGKGHLYYSLFALILKTCHEADGNTKETRFPTSCR